MNKKDAVSLLTKNLTTGEEKLTSGYEREELEKWIEHSKRECAEGILEWVLVEEGVKVYE